MSLKFDRQEHTPDMVTGHNAQHTSTPEFLTGRILTQNNALSQQLTPPSNLATHISPDNTLPIVEQLLQIRIEAILSTNLRKAIAGIAFQRQPHLSLVFFKPTKTNISIFDQGNEQFELFEDPFQASFKLQPEMTEEMKLTLFIRKF